MYTLSLTGMLTTAPSVQPERHVVQVVVGVFKLHALLPLPNQNQIIKTSENKKQRIQIICQNSDIHELGGHPHQLDVTGQDKVPVEISPGCRVIQRADLKTNHEEADTIATMQAIYMQHKRRRRKSSLKQMTQMSRFCCCTITLIEGSTSPR